MEEVCDRESTTQAAPPHTRQDAEADFFGGLIGGGDALSHSQNAMEFCKTRQPSTCWGRRGVQPYPTTNGAITTGHRGRPKWTQTKGKKGKESREGSMHMKKNTHKRQVQTEIKQKYDTMRNTEKIKSYNRGERTFRGKVTGYRWGGFLPLSSRYQGSGALIVVGGGLSFAELSLSCETTYREKTVIRRLNIFSHSCWDLLPHVH